MKHRTNYLALLLACASFGLLNTSIINSASAGQQDTKEQQASSGKIYGKVTESIDSAGYTYAEVDTGKEKVWAAAPTTQLKIGDMISFSSGMPMENYHSTSLDRDFPVIYFAGNFNTDSITDKETPTSEAQATAAPHAQIKQAVSKPVKEIKKVEDGNTIAEVYADKANLSGKTIRVRGQVTKFTPEIMGKNWIHIADNSTLDDLTVTIDKKVAVDDIVVVEGELLLDKDYGYGYVYPVILEDAKITNE